MVPLWWANWSTHFSLSGWDFNDSSFELWEIIIVSCERQSLVPGEVAGEGMTLLSFLWKPPFYLIRSPPPPTPGFSCTLTHSSGALSTTPSIPSMSLSQAPLSSSPQQLDIQGQQMCQQMETSCAPSWPLPSLGTKKGPVHMTERTCGGR